MKNNNVQNVTDPKTVENTPSNHWKPVFLPFSMLYFLFFVHTSVAAVPQPMVVYCGQAVDGYGWPYLENATVILQSGTNEITRQEIDGSISPGINYILYCNLDDNRRNSRYDPDSVVTGQTVSIIIQDTYGQKTIMESNSIPDIGAPGTVNIITVTAGADSDGDGLPDLWEQELVDHSGGAITNISDVHPYDDFDKDGVNNGSEYKAGTFAFLDYDYFYIDRMAQTDDLFDVSFITVPGKTYQLQSSTNLASRSWTNCPYFLDSTKQPVTIPAIGNGNRLHLYVPQQADHPVFRLFVE